MSRWTFGFTPHWIEWSRDGRKLYASDGPTLKVWDTTKGTIDFTHDGTVGRQFLQVSPDGKWLAATDQKSEMYIVNVDSGEAVLKLSWKHGQPRQLSWSSDSRRLACCGDSNFKVWDVVDGKEIFALSGDSPPKRVQYFAWSPDAKRLATQTNQQVEIRDAETGRELLTLRPSHQVWWTHLSLDWSPDSRQVALIYPKAKIQFFDATTGNETLMLGTAEVSNPVSTAWSPDGKRLVSASVNGIIKLWDPATGEELNSEHQHTQAVRCLAWHPNGRRLASWAGEEGIKIWDTDTWKVIAELRGEKSSQSSPGIATGDNLAAWSPNGEWLAWASAGGRVRLWENAMREELAGLSGHTNEVLGVAWSPDSMRLASISADQTIKVWTPRTGEEKTTLRGQSGRLASLAWSPDGRRLASGALDPKSIKVWDTATWQETRTLHGFGPYVGWTPGGQRLVTSITEGLLVLDGTAFPAVSQEEPKEVKK
jgi:WD40 repeat protein